MNIVNLISGTKATYRRRISITRLAVVAALLSGSPYASAGLLDQLLDKAKELTQPNSNSTVVASSSAQVTQTKRVETAFSTEQLLSINEPSQLAGTGQQIPNSLGNAAEFDPMICASWVRKLDGMNNEGSLVYGKNELTAEGMALRLSDCRFAQTRVALGQMASLFYSATRIVKDPNATVHDNGRAEALQVIANAFVDAGNFPQAVEASQLSIKYADTSPSGVSQRVYAIRAMIHALVAQGNRGAGEEELFQFVRQNKTSLEQRGVMPALFALGEAYQRLGYPEKAAYVYRHTSSSLNNAMNSQASNPFAAAVSAMAGMQCMFNDQFVKLAGQHLSNAYICDTPYHGTSLAEVRFAQMAALSGKADELADYYRNVFQPSLNIKTPEGWLAPPVLPAKIRAHAELADALEKVHRDDLALDAWERIADDIARFEDFIASQTMLDDSGSVTHEDFAKYLGRFLLIATKTKTADKQTKALGYWLSFKGLAAMQYKFGLELLARSTNGTIANALTDAEKKRVQVRQEFLNSKAIASADAVEIYKLLAPLRDISNKVFEARSEFVQNSSGMIDKEVSIQQSARTILTSIQNSLTEDGAFVDFAHTLNSEGESIYLMTVIEKTGNFTTTVIRGKNIDDSIAELQRTIRATVGAGQVPAKETIDRQARVMFDSVAGPLLAATGGKPLLHISPDGVLGSFPFEISVDRTGRYPLSEKIVSYVSAPRDFVARPGDREISGITVVANPDYLGDIPPATGANRYVGRGFQFPALPDTEIEAKFISDIGRKQGMPTVMFSGASATKSALLKEPIKGNLLHFATHGFYFSDDPKNEFGDATVGKRFSDRNPLWRAGLAMAGANSDRRSGILYAAEVLRMDLRDVDIVVLSACDTGSGYLSSAEGIIGLTRAFTISGARSIISSKWPVSSAETVKFMEHLYEQKPRGNQAAKAMRDARLQMINKFPNPYLWGGFTLSQSGN